MSTEEQSEQPARTPRRPIAFFHAGDAQPLGAETMASESVDEAVVEGLSRLAGLQIARGLGEMNLLLFKETGCSGDEGFSLVYLWFKSGYVLPPHSHNGNCLYYVIGGELHIGNKILRKGDGMFVPAGSVYTYEAGAEGVEVLEFRNATRFNIELKGNEAGRWDRVASAFRQRAAIWETETLPPSERKSP